MAINIDLSIVDGDFVLSPTLTAQKLSEASVVSQDIKHRVLESGLLVKLVKLRNINGIAQVLTEIELEVEKDDRLVPGTIYVHHNDDKTLSIKAQTKQYNKAALEANP